MWRCALALVVFWTWAVPVRADGIPINLQTTEGMDLPWVRHLQESFIPAVDAALADSRLSVDWQLHLGDGVMATFGTPRSGPRDAANALACAHAMLDEIAQWNRTRAEAGHPAINVGIGVHYGPVVLGDTGGEHRLEFAVIGDTVNVASRLERLTRETDTGLIASDDLVATALEQDANGAAQTLSTMTKLAPQQVRGRDEALELWGKS